MEQKLDLVIRSVRKTRNTFALGFFFIGGFGGLVIYLSLTTDEGGIAGLIFGGFLVLLALFGVKIMWPHLRPARSPVVTLLREHPEKIAWVCDIANPGPRGRTITHSVIVGDVDKRQHTFNVKVAEVEGMMEILKSIAPRATFGWSKENDEKYKQDPFSMISPE